MASGRIARTALGNKEPSVLIGLFEIPPALILLFFATLGVIGFLHGKSFGTAGILTIVGCIGFVTTAASSIANIVCGLKARKTAVK